MTSERSKCRDFLSLIFISKSISKKLLINKNRQGDFFIINSAFPSVAGITRMLISRAAGKSCQLDPFPTPIDLKLLDVVLPVITKLINLSFDTGRFAEAWKVALVLPSLKKPGLDFALKNFRPVGNLSYISKLSERARAEQFMEHLTANNLHSLL